MKYGFKIVLAGIISLMILSLFTTLYCNSGIHITNTTGATDYKWEPNQLKTTMTEGFSWFYMDSEGFNNKDERQSVINNLLMGSSHMEATEINPNQTVAALLNRRSDSYTYNIGMSGHQIYNCVNNLRDAVIEYKPTDCILLETDRAMLDVESMKKVVDGTYPHIRSYDTGLMYMVQKYIPVIKHLYNQIDVWRKPTQLDEHSPNLDEEYQEALDMFLQKASTDAGDTRLIIFYQPTTKIESDGTIINQTSEEALHLFSDSCEKHGISFVDMTEDFQELYDSQHILAHGFINTGVGIGHLNQYGHETIANRLVQVVRGGD